MEKEDIKSNIISTLKSKASLKQTVYDNTVKVFSELKEIMQDLSDEYNKLLNGTDERVKLVYRDDGMFWGRTENSGGSDDIFNALQCLSTELVSRSSNSLISIRFLFSSIPMPLK